MLASFDLMDCSRWLKFTKKIKPSEEGLWD